MMIVLALQRGGSVETLLLWRLIFVINARWSVAIGIVIVLVFIFCGVAIVAVYTERETSTIHW